MGRATTRSATQTVRKAKAVNRQEFEAMEDRASKPTNWLAEYMKALGQVPTSGYTLLYGQDMSGNTVHFYMAPDGHGVIRVIYDDAGNLKENHHRSLNGDVQELMSYEVQPTLQPAACDMHFCQWLRDRGLYLPFTRYKNLPAPPSGFYGLILAPDGNTLIEASASDTAPEDGETHADPMDRPYAEALMEAFKTRALPGEDYLNFVERQAFRAVCIPEHWPAITTKKDAPRCQK